MWSLIISISLDYVCYIDNDCNSHGSCNDGTCDCDSGWDSKSDCSGNKFNNDRMHQVLPQHYFWFRGKKSHYPSLCLQNYLEIIWVAQILPTRICCFEVSCNQNQYNVLGAMGFYIFLNSLKRGIFFQLNPALVMQTVITKEYVTVMAALAIVDGTTNRIVRVILVKFMFSTRPL